MHALCAMGAGLSGRVPGGAVKIPGAMESSTMTELGGVPISERAKRLNEALFELWGQAARLMVIQTFLDEASHFGWEHHKRRLLLGYVPCILDGTHSCDQPACHSGPCDEAATPARALDGVGATVEKANEDGGDGSVAE